MAQGDGVYVRFDKATVESSPNISGEEIPQETERSLYDHYGVSYSDERSESTLPEGKTIFEFLEIFHNRKRRHSAFGIHAPVEYEMLHARRFEVA